MKDVNEMTAHQIEEELMVEAGIRSDQGSCEEVFDGSFWLRSADCEEIYALAASDWTGENADDIAYFESNRGNAAVMSVLEFCERSMGRPADMQEGFTVRIDEHQAMAWLAQHRPEVASAIREDEPASKSSRPGM